MIEGRAYTQKEADTLAPAIDPKTGANLSPDVVSAEEALKAFPPAPDTPTDGTDPDAEKKLVETKPPVLGDKAKQEEEDAAAAAAEAAEKARKEAAGETAEGDPADKVITVGGTSKTKAEWLKDAEEFYAADLSGLNGEQQDKILKGYIASEHDAAWKASNTQKSQEIAQQRQGLEAERRAIEQRRQEVARQKQAMEKRVAKLKEVAADPITENDIRDEGGGVDVVKLTKFQKVQAAREQLQAIEEDLQGLSDQSAQADNDQLLADVRLLQASHPELSTELPIEQVAAAVEKGGRSAHAEADKYLDIVKVMSEASSLKISVEEAFDRLAKLGQLVSKATMPQAPVDDKTTKQKEREKMAAEIAKKQRESTTTIKAGGGITPRDPGIRKSLGDRIRESSMGASGGNEALTKLGY